MARRKEKLGQSGTKVAHLKTLQYLISAVTKGQREMLQLME